MKFRTEYNPVVSSRGTIPHNARIILAGSCFSENIGVKMTRTGWNTMINPFGIIFNPLSIAESIKSILRNKKFKKNDFFEASGLWYNYQLHGSFAGTSQEAARERINGIVRKAHDFLLKTDVLILTFGTAWVYELNQSGKVVANCHKVPGKNFTRRVLSVGEIVNRYSILLNHLRDVNPSLRIIFTVSPVRHLRDGMIENSLSKSTLLLAAHELIGKFEFAEYFPAYEIQMDDLRDYRFVGKDMCHPNEIAVDYIWQKFADTYFDEKTKSEMKVVEDWVARINHRPLSPNSTSWKKFEAALEKESAVILKKYPHLKSIAG